MAVDISDGFCTVFIFFYNKEVFVDAFLSYFLSLYA